MRIRRDSIIYEVKTIVRPLFVPTLLPQRLACICWVYSCGMVRMSGTAPGWTPVGSRGGGRWELLVFLLHLARFARALRGDWHRLGKRTDGFYFVDNRITPDSHNMLHICCSKVILYILVVQLGFCFLNLTRLSLGLQWTLVITNSLGPVKLSKFCYIRVAKNNKIQRNFELWDQENYFVMRLSIVSPL